MQQRQLRLGDILDDYCPRERRVTNHAVVAMVGEEIRQTRCTTCDAEHEYKQARVPPQRKKRESGGVLQQQPPDSLPRRVVPASPPDQDPTEGPPAETEPVFASVTEVTESEVEHEHEGPVHRRLIRAQLPRLEGQEPPARREPEFTIRQAALTRQGRFRSGGGQFRGANVRNGQGFGSQANGNRAASGSRRQQGGRPHPANAGSGHGQQRQRHGGHSQGHGKKRSR